MKEGLENDTWVSIYPMGKMTTIINKHLESTKALDGVLLLNQCIHNIDLLQWMMAEK